VARAAQDLRDQPEAREAPARQVLRVERVSLDLQDRRVERELPVALDLRV
jgi:hypothetical protein